MIDETDISQEKKLYYKERAETIIENFKKRHINGLYAPTGSEALAAAMSMIPPGAVVAHGDSISVEQIGLSDELAKRGQNKVINFLKRNVDGSPIYTPEERRLMEQEAFTADVFITGTNAITLDGKLVNTDGIGNRVAMMIYGPRKVVLIIGANKIVKNEEEARQRIRDIAAPMNVIRHYTKHKIEALGKLPCVKTGRCVDCSSEARICRYTVIIEGADMVHKGRINVILVGEELGL
jgi:L-lactate utilization protein LutB